MLDTPRPSTRLVASPAARAALVKRGPPLPKPKPPPAPIKLKLPKMVGPPEAPRVPSPRERYLMGRSRRVRTVLAERWPELFSAPVPLAIGIREQLAAVPDLGLNPLWTRRFLQWWCNRGVYRAALTSGARRRNLDGSVYDPAPKADAGPVTATETPPCPPLA